NWADWRALSHSFEEIGMTRPVANFNLTGEGPPERLQGARFTWNVIPVLGVAPLFGRNFTKDEDRAAVVLLSYHLWERRFGKDPSVVGHKIELNGGPYEVIGVMPQEFRYPTKDYDVWAPLFIPQSEIDARADMGNPVVARLKSGV